MEEHRENDEEFPEEERRRGRGVFYFIIAIVLIGAIAAGIWWVLATLRGPQQSDLVGPLDGYFLAGARNDREAANSHIYMGPDAAELGADDFSGEFSPDTFFAYRGVRLDHYFADANNGYLYGFIEYNERPPREFTAVVRRDEQGRWGLLRLWLSEPMPGSTPNSVLVAGSGR